MIQKTIGSDQEMVAKHNALIDYIENLKNKNIIAVGGIIVPKDGSWKYPSSKINNNFNDDNWQIFDPVNIAKRLIMASKGLDYTFVHHGVRQEDLKLLETIAIENEIDPEWLKNLLQSFHEKKTKNAELDDKEIIKLIEEHLNKI